MIQRGNSRQLGSGAGGQESNSDPYGRCYAEAEAQRDMCRKCCMGVQTDRCPLPDKIFKQSEDCKANQGADKNNWPICDDMFTEQNEKCKATYPDESMIWVGAGNWFCKDGDYTTLFKEYLTQTNMWQDKTLDDNPNDDAINVNNPHFATSNYGQHFESPWFGKQNYHPLGTEFQHIPVRDEWTPYKSDFGKGLKWCLRACSHFARATKPDVYEKGRGIINKNGQFTSTHHKRVYCDGVWWSETYKACRLYSDCHQWDNDGVTCLADSGGHFCSCVQEVDLSPFPPLNADIFIPTTCEWGMVHARGGRGTERGTLYNSFAPGVCTETPQCEWACNYLGYTKNALCTGNPANDASDCIIVDRIPPGPTGSPTTSAPTEPVDAVADAFNMGFVDVFKWLFKKPEGQGVVIIIIILIVFLVMKSLQTYYRQKEADKAYRARFVKT